MAATKSELFTNHLNMIDSITKNRIYNNTTTTNHMEFPHMKLNDFYYQYLDTIIDNIDLPKDEILSIVNDKLREFIYECEHKKTPLFEDEKLLLSHVLTISLFDNYYQSLKIIKQHKFFEHYDFSIFLDFKNYDDYTRASFYNSVRNMLGFLKKYEYIGELFYDVVEELNNDYNEKIHIHEDITPYFDENNFLSVLDIIDQKILDNTFNLDMSILKDKHIIYQQILTTMAFNSLYMEYTKYFHPSKYIYQTKSSTNYQKIFEMLIFKKDMDTIHLYTRTNKDIESKWEEMLTLMKMQYDENESFI